LPAWALPAFLASAVVSLVASGQLVRALEHLGAHFGTPQVLLGLVAALAADGPELTSAIAALLAGQHAIGLGVLFGSNVFNIAALLGLGSVVAVRVSFHRRVIVLEGVAATGVAATSVAFVSGAIGPGTALALTLLFFVPYVVIAAVPVQRLWLPAAWKDWLAEALLEEGEELQAAQPLPWGGSAKVAGVVAVVTVLTVIAASAFMEHAASVGGSALGIPEVILGGVVLAAVTSLPNAVAAVHLGRGGKGAAMLSVGMNSNTLNVVGGLAIPGLIGGFAVDEAAAGTIFTGASYAAMTALALALAYRGKGLARPAGALLLVTYGAFLGVLFAMA
jgi:cation:H+ antiporter